MKRLEFTVYGTPAPKGSLQPGGARCKACGGSGRLASGACPRCRGRGFYTWAHEDCARTRPWMASLKAEAQQAARALAGGPLYCGPVQVDLCFWLPKPKSLPKRRPCSPTKKPDLDKLIRSVLDALTGVVWNDDAQVVCLVCSKHYADRPGCRAVVMLLDLPDVTETDPDRAAEESF
jgi:crossover junction endodeoxyribonuclease RusA